MRMDATATILVKRELEDVFEYIADPLNQDEWVDGVSEPHLITDGQVAKGSKYGFKYTYGGGTHDVVTEVCLYDPPKAFGVRSRDGPFPFRGMVTLTKDREGTLVSNTIDAESDGLFTSFMFAVFGPLMRRSMRKQLRKELEVLKGRLET
jgi:hypothetical protein